MREGQAIGCKVTLRGDRMWEFLDRLLATALPRVRDFRGISPKSFDGRGNYTLGITEQLIFPEIEYDKIDRTRGMDITFVTNAGDNDSAFALLSALGFPFKSKVNRPGRIGPRVAQPRSQVRDKGCGLKDIKKEGHAWLRNR